MERNIDLGLAQSFTKASRRATMAAIKKNVIKVAHKEMIKYGAKFYLRVGTIANFCKYSMPKLIVYAHSSRLSIITKKIKAVRRIAL